MDKTLLHIKAFIAEEKQAIDESTHSILFTIPEIVDRSDEIVTAEAIYKAIIDKNTFAANPICLPCHQHRLEGGEPPCVGSWDVASAKQLKNAVNIRLNFAFQTKLGEAYWSNYSNKHMRAISIGFSSEESHVENKGGKQITVITLIELFEMSCVAVGCNQGALSKLKSVGEWQDFELSKEVENELRKIAEKIFEEKSAELRAEIEDLKTLIIPDSGELAELLLSGNDSESHTSAGKNKKSGQSTLTQILKVIEKHRSN